MVVPNSFAAGIHRAPSMTESLLTARRSLLVLCRVFWLVLAAVVWPMNVGLAASTTYCYRLKAFNGW